MAAAFSSAGDEASTYQLEPPQLEALAEPSVSSRGTGATAHLPASAAALALIVPTIQTPIGTAATSPPVKEPVKSVQPETGFARPLVQSFW